MATVVANSGPAQPAQPVQSDAMAAAVNHTSQQLLVDMITAQQKQITELKDTIIALTQTISNLTGVPVTPITQSNFSKPVITNNHKPKSYVSSSQVSDSDTEGMDTSSLKKELKRKRGSGSSPVAASAKKQAASMKAQQQQGSHGFLHSKLHG